MMIKVGGLLLFSQGGRDCRPVVNKTKQMAWLSVEGWGGVFGLSIKPAAVSSVTPHGGICFHMTVVIKSN